MMMDKPVDILITSSKGDNFRLNGVTEIRGDRSQISFRSGEDIRDFDTIMRDRDIELVNVEVEDIGL